ncbi:MAG: hypothetical protein JWR17_5162 [Pseudomonas sp.]|jgi:hypothetical protein|uniref:hypothetical protein n=1 Tax=Pseudomonas sp. TaxID=306 RepID=UPI0026032295|nr:hypothetical protein [Pseudomonas sp.]MDB6052416.1 hypothetical protein [Pseudomonas sp.]
MYLIEVFLPVNDNDGLKQPGHLFGDVRKELVRQFGGMTAFTRSPATGIWDGAENGRREDEIVIYEVMADTLDRTWWKAYKADLEKRFRQDELVIRSSELDLL